MRDAKYKIIGLAWVFAAVVLATVLAVGISPLIRIIPWSWEKVISRYLGSVSAGEVCHNSKADVLLQRIVQRLYPVERNDSKFSVDVQVVNDPMVNAFAELGGKILLNTGLLEKAQSPEEVAGVLAHEIEHVRHRHVLEGFVTYLMTIEGIRVIFSGGSTSNAKLAHYFLHMSFSRSQEAQADEGALLRLQKAHIDNRGYKQFFERMKTTSSLPSVFSDHPSEQSRSEMAEKFQNQDTRLLLTDEEWKTLRAYCQ